MPSSLTTSNDIAAKIALNNRAAKLLAAGRCEEAAALLMDQVRCYREGRALEGLDPPPPLNSPPTATTPTASSSPGQEESSLLLEVLIVADELLEDELKYTSAVAERRRQPKRRRQPIKGFIYATPIFLPIDNDLSSPSSSPTSTSTTPMNHENIRLAIIFNFAMARHMRALYKKDVSRQEDRLRTALKLYNWVITLERSMKDDDDDDDEMMLPFGVLPCLGLINNCAQIHTQLNKLEKADRMFRLLLSYLMLVKDGEEDFPKSELDGFFMSTSHLIFKRQGVARAA